MKMVTWLSPGDPSQRTGGFLYNARMTQALEEMGISVSILVLEGQWPREEQTDIYGELLDAIQVGTTVVADGLLWSSLGLSTRKSLCQRCDVWVVMHTFVLFLIDFQGTRLWIRREMNVQTSLVLIVITLFLLIC